MKTKLIVLILAVCIFTACKKEYTCECINPGGVFKTYIIRDTEKNADKRCDEYSQQYQTVPMSETVCRIK